MKITAYPVDGGEPVVLGDDTAGDYIVGGEPNQGRASQENELFRAPEIFRRSRDNKRTVLEWTVSREHADLKTAFEFAWDHADQIPGNAHLKVEHAGATRWLQNAVVKGVNHSDRVTRSTRFHYSAIGGTGAQAAPAGV